MSQFRWLFAAAGAVLGIVATSFIHHLQPPQAQAQVLQPRTAIGSCDVPPSFGSLKGVWEEWLLFEDAAGTLRSVDGSCQVRHVVRRQ